MKKYRFVLYNNKNVILLSKYWSTGWNGAYITKTGLIKPVNHIIFEQDITCEIEPVKIKENCLETLKIYHNDFVEYYKKIMKNK